jgi:ppGpp synthetase/RelA/SpoT-type nucleotidyltranferase
VPRISDLVRTRLVCSYLDAAPFLAEKLKNLADEFNANPILDQKGSIEGYFAQHLNFEVSVFFRFAGSEQQYRLSCEVQVATLLATAIWQAAHPIYESARTEGELAQDWQWSPKNPKFLARQLGHMVHLADGLLCTLRDAHGANRTLQENTH